MDDLVDIIDALLIFDLGDDLDVTLAAVEDLLYLIYILAGADKRVSDEVHIVIHGEEDRVPIPLGNGGEVDADVGDVDALMRAYCPVVEYRTVECGLVLSDHPETEQSIVEEHGSALRYIVDKAGIIDIDHLIRTWCCGICLDAYQLIRSQLDRFAIGCCRSTHLRSLRVHHDGHAVADGADVMDHPLKALMGHVCRVHPDDIDPGVEDLLEKLLIAMEVRDRSHDLSRF